jgi:hypothetical protein
MGVELAINLSHYGFQSLPQFISSKQLSIRVLSSVIQFSVVR